MSQTPALIHVSTALDLQELMDLFFSEQSIEQVNLDLVNIITLIGRNIKNSDVSQEERERFFTYMLQLQRVYQLLNGLAGSK